VTNTESNGNDRSCGRKVANMKRVTLAGIVALFALAAGTTSASAAPPIDVNAVPVVGGGGVTVTASVGGQQIQSMTAGSTVSGDEGKPGICAVGIHTSCTPADEASGR
jgi:hypothetical protein